MANVVRNRLVIKAIEPRLKEITDFLAGEPDENGLPRHIDFQRIVPMPDDLPPTIRTDGIMGWAVLEHRGCLGYSKKEVKKQFDALRPEERNEWLMLGQQYRDNTQKYGHATGLDWCMARWGTQENAFDQEKRADNEIWFNTRYSHAGRLITALSLEYPEAVFEYSYAEDNAGANCGKVIAQNGAGWVRIPEPDTKEAFEISFEMWPEIRVLFDFDGDTYHLRKES
jgi:hypothetical protein